MDVDVTPALIVIEDEEVARVLKQVDAPSIRASDAFTERDRLVCRYFMGPGKYMRYRTYTKLKKAGLPTSMKSIDRTLAKPEAQDFMDYLQWELVSQANITPEELTRRAACVVRASVTDLFDVMPDGRILLRDLDKLPEELKYAIKKIKFSRRSAGTETRDGTKHKIWEESAEIELESRAPYMAMLSEWLNMKERAKGLTQQVAKITGLKLTVAKGDK